MADDLTPGEIRRAIERLEQAQKDSNKASDDRVANLAQQMVPAALWAAEHKALVDDVKHLETDVHEGFDRVERISVERRTVLEADITKIRKGLEGHEKTHRDDHQWSRSKTMTVIAIAVGAAATLAGAWIAAVLASKGVG